MSAAAQNMRHWEAVKSSLKTEFGDATYDSWIKHLSVSSIDEGVVTLGAPTKFVCDRVQSDYGDRIKAAWLKQDPEVRRVVYEVGVGDFEGRPELITTPPREGAPADIGHRIGAVARHFSGARAKAAEKGDGLQSIRLDEKFTFDRYVVGRPNEFAYSAARRVAEDPNTPFNPLFLHGNPGLGKTHLLHSIAWRRRELFPNEKCVFISAETFLVEFMTALRHRTTHAFKELLRSADILIIDDVQHIVGKNYTQEEFFHTFNALVEQKRQMVLSADVPPTALDGLDDRLRSRLGWGLVADLHPTDYELRLAILQSKTEHAMESTPGLEVEGKVLDFLARRISTDVRTLEGALNRLFAIAAMSKRPATVEMAQRELQDLLRHSDRKVSVEEIQKTVAQHYNMRIADMFSPRRSRSVARPRQVAMYLCKVLTQKSLPDIGSKFGGRDHTTVMHAVKKVKELRETDAAFDDDVERLRRTLEG